MLISGNSEKLTCGEDTLLHGETLFVISSSNAKDISLPLISKRVGFYFSAHTLLVEDANFAFIFNVDQLLCPSGGVADVQLQITNKKTRGKLV